jgi:putative transposase
MKLLDKRPLSDYPLPSIKRVRLVRRADGFYCQFVTDMERSEPQETTSKTVGIDLGLLAFYTDSNGDSIPCPKPLRQAEKRLKQLQRRVSRKKKGSSNRSKARKRLARQHLKVARQRKDFAAQTARALIQSNDLVAYEDLQIKNLVRNHHLAKSIHDAAWAVFLSWLVYYGRVFGKVVVAVPAAYTSQDCSACGRRVVKALSERTHRCLCGVILDRDLNAARNILEKALLLVAGHTGGHPEMGEGEPPERLGRSDRYAGSDPGASRIAEPRIPPL